MSDVNDDKETLDAAESLCQRILNILILEHQCGGAELAFLGAFLEGLSDGARDLHVANGSRGELGREVDRLRPMLKERGYKVQSEYSAERLSMKGGDA